MKNATKRFTIPSKKKLRNLVQYRDMTDAEFDEVWENRTVEVDSSEEFEVKIKEKLSEFEDDYDLSGMKVNDIANLRSLIQLTITLEDYEQKLFATRAEDSGVSNIQYAEKLTKIMSILRDDISKIQNDLKITRKVRTSDRDISVIAFIDELKQKARKFYKAKMNYIYCPECNMLLGTVWSLYPTKSKYSFVCQRTLATEEKCNTKFEVTVEELIKNKGTNSLEVTPEAML